MSVGGGVPEYSGGEGNATAGACDTLPTDVHVHVCCARQAPNKRRKVDDAINRAHIHEAVLYK